MSSDGGQTRARSPPGGLNPHDDARAIVRLFQCQQCSYPLKDPVTFPCGNSLCRRCLPPSFKREHITYPIDSSRSEGIVCPFRDCGLPHALGDCGNDVTLNKIVSLVRSYVETYRTQAPDASVLLDEKLHWPDVVESSIDIMPRSRVLQGGRVVATYVFADMGELNYYSDVAYTPTMPQSTEAIKALDVVFVNSLREMIHAEVECQVCYSLMLDPLTTSCGHTFCRKCVARVLDHSTLCPICRRKLSMLPGVQGEPSNKSISNLMTGILTEFVAARAVLAQQEDAVDEDERVPLFPCTLAYPNMPTFLHIFEPRYRLMIRRVVENGSRKFGILAYNAARRPQGPLGLVPFMQYGTMLHISRIEQFPDGRSLIETFGAYRFRVVEHSMLDGYMVGKVQRIADMSLAEEEANEMRETSGPAPDPEAEDFRARAQHMSTQQLLEYGLEFITSARSRSASWLHERVLAAYGQPPSDPATFPYWFASVLPISEDAKYLLLPTTSVRERLQITARWIHGFETAQRAHDRRILARTVLDSSSDEGEDLEEEEDDDENDGEENATIPAEDPDALTTVAQRDPDQQPPSAGSTGPTSSSGSSHENVAA